MENTEVKNYLQEWLNKRPIWLTYPLSDILNMKEISLSDIERYSQLCAKEANDEKVVPENIDFHQITSGYDSCDTTIKKISNLQNVNAISPNRTLEFAEKGITVIYGRNGSGKSGYVRALKKAFGIPGCELIRSNVFNCQGKKKSDSRCTIELSSRNGMIECLLDSEANILSGALIFDTSISQDYIGKTREASFEPMVFSVLRKLAEIVDQVSINLSEKRRDIKPVLPIFSDELSNTNIAKKYSILDSETKIAEDFLWTSEDENRLNELCESLHIMDPITIVEAITRKEEATNFLLQYILNLSSFFTQPRIDLIEDHYSKMRVLHKEHQVLCNSFSDNANVLDKNGIGQEQWIKLWQYANAYISIFQNSKIGSETCPLCQQKMEGEVLSRFVSINEFVNSHIASEIEKTGREYKDSVSTSFKLLDLQTTKLLIEKSGFNDINNMLLNTINETSVQINKIQCQEIAEDKEYLALNANEFTDVVSDLSKYLEELTSKKNMAMKLDDDSTREILNNEKLDLLARKYCNQNRKLFEKAITDYKKASVFDKAERLAKTNAITVITNSLAQELLSKEYEKKFNEELLKLASNSLKVRLKQVKGGKGKTPFKIVIENELGEDFNPNDILSEGEQRIVSIAAFIADSIEANKKSALIFDDPISSLDFEYEKKAVSRLVELASTYQVIVFTHRLAFACKLYETCKKEGVGYSEKSLLFSEAEKGIPCEGITITKIVKKRINEILSTELPRIRSKDIADPEYNTYVRGICSCFREAVEKSIEEILLCDVASRFNEEIHSKNVVRLARVTSEDCDIVDRMMTKYSIKEHSQSDETPYDILSISEIEDDLKTFLEWAKEAKKRLCNS